MILKERVVRAFRFEEVRPTPYTVWYDEAIRLKLNEHFGSGEWEQRIRNHVFRVNVDWRPRDYIRDGEFSDVHGSIWQEGDPEHLVRPALSEPSLKGFTIPSYLPYLAVSRKSRSPQAYTGRAQLSFAEAPEVLQQYGEEAYTVVDYGYGLFETCWMIRGYQEFFMDLVDEPRFAAGLLDLVLERHLEVVDALVQLPCDAIMVVDDYGDQRGVAVGPERWRQFIKPRLARLYERIHGAGKSTFHHSCGNVFDIIPDLIDCGLDVLQSVQPEAMPVYEIKRRFGSSLRLWGGLGTQRLLPFGSPREIQAEVRRLKRQLGAGGGYVLTSSKPIMPEVPAQNAAALVEASIAEDE